MTVFTTTMTWARYMSPQHQQPYFALGRTEVAPGVNTCHLSSQLATSQKGRLGMDFDNS